MAISAGCARISVAALAALTFLAQAPATTAAPRTDEAVVPIGDLDFTSPSDVARFRQRVDRAARGLCGREQQLDFYEAHACYRGVTRHALGQLSRDQRRELLATSRGRAGRP